jgi:hypothetical protein
MNYKDLGKYDPYNLLNRINNESGFPAATEDYVRIIEIKGMVKIKNSDTQWYTAKEGDLLQPNTMIFVGLKSSVVIGQNNCKVLVDKLGQDYAFSLFKIYPKVSDGYLKYGRIKATVNKNREVNTVFKVRSAQFTSGVRG